MPNNLISACTLYFLVVILSAYQSTSAVPAAHSDVALPLDHLPALSGDYFEIESRIVGRPFHIYIRFPEGYDKNLILRQTNVDLISRHPRRMPAVTKAERAISGRSIASNSIRPEQWFET